MTEAAADFQLNLQIIPIGIQYESHFYPRGRTLISFGKPIRVADFKDIYQDDQNAAYDAIVMELWKSLKGLILHIDADEDYDQVLDEYLRRRIFRRDLKAQLDSDQRLVNTIVDGTKFDEQSDKKNLPLMVLAKVWQVIWAIAGAVPKWIVELLFKRTKDPHFFGTIRFVYSIFLYPIILLVLLFLIKYLVF
jgi:hypothetical protein